MLQSLNSVAAKPRPSALQVDKGAVVKELGKSSGGGQPVQATAWSPHGQPLVSCDKTGTVSFWRD